MGYIENHYFRERDNMNTISRSLEKATTPIPSGIEITMLDVRSPGEFAMGHVRGALNVPLDQLPQAIEQVVPDKKAPLLLYCASGARSGMACSILQQMGYKDVRNGCNAGLVSQELNLPIQRL
jgi:phage shock protein E